MARIPRVIHTMRNQPSMTEVSETQTHKRLTELVVSVHPMCVCGGEQSNWNVNQKTNRMAHSICGTYRNIS